MEETILTLETHPYLLTTRIHNINLQTSKPSILRIRPQQNGEPKLQALVHFISPTIIYTWHQLQLLQKSSLAMPSEGRRKS